MKFWLVILTSVLFLSGCGKSVEQVHLSGSTMGTSYNIKYLADNNTIPDSKTMHKEIDQWLEGVNDQMSTYRKQSELSRFNQYQGTEPFTVSADLVTVVKEAMRINQVTNGALDITVGPLVNLWGFGPEARPEIIPTDHEIAQRRTEVGIQHLKVASDDTLTKDIPHLYVDLSSIAKGRGVDEVAKLLESHGVKNYMVEIGGETYTKGLNHEGVPWRIAIEKPVVGERAVQEIIEPGDKGIATSGDYRNYFEEDGHRYSHIINPTTGHPIDNKVVSVTVIADTTMTADGFATGLMVLGDVKGIDIAEAEHLPVFMIVKTKDGFKEVYSSAFKPYLNRQ